MKERLVVLGVWEREEGPWTHEYREGPSVSCLLCGRDGTHGVIHSTTGTHPGEGSQGARWFPWARGGIMVVTETVPIVGSNMVSQIRVHGLETVEGPRCPLHRGLAWGHPMVSQTGTALPKGHLIPWSPQVARSPFTSGVSYDSNRNQNIPRNLRVWPRSGVGF